MMASNPMLFQMMNMMANSGQQEIPITMIGKRSGRASPSCPGTPASSPKNDSQEQEVPPSEPEAKAAEAPKIPLFDLGAPDEKDLESDLQKKAQSMVASQAKVMERALEERAMKKPATCNPKAKAKSTASKSETKAIKKDQEGGLKMDRKNIHSRTYTAAKLKFLKQGFKLEDAVEKASAVAANELKKHGFVPHPKNRPNKKK